MAGISKMGHSNTEVLGGDHGICHLGHSLRVLAFMFIRQAMKSVYELTQVRHDIFFVSGFFKDDCRDIRTTPTPKAQQKSCE